MPDHEEGTIESGWFLMDYGDVIVNIFSSFEREYYKLDKLWNKAAPVVMIQ